MNNLARESRFIWYEEAKRIRPQQMQNLIYNLLGEIYLSISRNCELTVINARAAVTLLEQRPEKIQALCGIRTHDLCDANAALSQLSYQSHMRAVVCGLAL